MGELLCIDSSAAVGVEAPAPEELRRRPAAPTARGRAVGAFEVRSTGWVVTGGGTAPPVAAVAADDEEDDVRLTTFDAGVVAGTVEIILNERNISI